MSDRVFKRWYKDRDFPEVKSGNDDVIAVISDLNQLTRIIDSHNLLLEKLLIAKEALEFYQFQDNKFFARIDTGPGLWEGDRIGLHSTFGAKAREALEKLNVD